MESNIIYPSILCIIYKCIYLQNKSIISNVAFMHSNINFQLNFPPSWLIEYPLYNCILYIYIYRCDIGATRWDMVRTWTYNKPNPTPFIQSSRLACTISFHQYRRYLLFNTCVLYTIRTYYKYIYSIYCTRV